MTFIRALKKRYKKRKNKKILERVKQANLPPVVDFYEYKRQGIEFNKDKIERLVLGSSHGQAAVDTGIIPKTFNLSIASQDMYQSFKLCEKYIPTLPHLKTIILFFSVFSSGAEMQKTVNAPLCQYYKNVFDIDFKYPWNGVYYKDAIDFMKSIPSNSQDIVLYDPPYSPRQVSESYKGFGKKVTALDTSARWRKEHLDEIERILKNDGVLVSFGWNTNGGGKKRGFNQEEILLVSHGGSHNDTLATVERIEK